MAGVSGVFLPVVLSLKPIMEPSGVLEIYVPNKEIMEEVLGVSVPNWESNGRSYGSFSPRSFATQANYGAVRSFGSSCPQSPTTKKNKVWIFFCGTFVLVRPSVHACDPVTS